VGGQFSRGDRRWSAGKPWLVGECEGVAGMQPGPLAGQQVSIDNLPQQRMPEFITILAGLGHQQLVVDHDPEGVDQVRLVQAGHAGQEPMRHPPAGHGHHRQ
jgi:hypothetical protein